MFQPSDVVISFVCALPNINVETARRFRSYPVSKNSSANCTIWEAARATTAAPTFFKGIEIAGTGGIKERFVDAGLNRNNPSKELRDEARNLFGDNRRIGVFISIGTGHPDIIGFDKPGQLEKVLPVNLIKTLKNIATNCEDVHRELSNQYSELPGVYFRFNVDHGAGQVSLAEWNKIGEVVTHTKNYLGIPEVSKHIEQVVEGLCDQLSMSGSVTLANLCRS